MGLEKQPVAAQWVARAMFVDARSHVGDPRRGSPCTVGSAGGQSITTVRQAPPVGAIDYRLHAPRPEEGQSSAATGYAGAAWLAVGSVWVFLGRTLTLILIIKRRGTCLGARG